MVKCSEVLQYSDGLSNKVSNIIRGHMDSMMLLFVYSLGCIFINVCMVVFLFNIVIYVFLSLRLFILTVCLCIFIMPADTLRLP